MILPCENYSPNGKYYVNFYINGKYSQIVIDDKFYRKNDEFYNCGCESPQKLWMPLIEKAWAKIHGGFDKIDRGSSN